MVQCYWTGKEDNESKKDKIVMTIALVDISSQCALRILVKCIENFLYISIESLLIQNSFLALKHKFSQVKNR